ncbi:MAG: copper amine oxidase N-terminal domain-containing protein [Clostridia bacterium]|nr:copper amine oxidase N-terminal domain-containing protein [Clostridia bacterium]
MKKFILVLCFILGLSSFCFAASENVTVLINKQVKVSFNEELQEFQNVKGDRVYPITFEGTTYLPIRAISSLFGSEIKWDGETNSVYLGEGELDETSARGVEEFVGASNEEVEVLLNEDIAIYFGGEVQTFTDVNGKVVYPLSYEGTTYLPVRAVSNLFGLLIDWDGEQNAVLISYADIEDVSGDENSYDENLEAVLDEELSGETVLDEELSDGEEAIVIDNEVYTYVDDNGKDIYYYYNEDGDVFFYFFDENENVIHYYFDSEGNIVYSE